MQPWQPNPSRGEPPRAILPADTRPPPAQGEVRFPFVERDGGVFFDVGQDLQALLGLSTPTIEISPPAGALRGRRDTAFDHNIPPEDRAFLAEPVDHLFDRFVAAASTEEPSTEPPSRDLMNRMLHALDFADRPAERRLLRFQYHLMDRHIHDLQFAIDVALEREPNLRDDIRAVAFRNLDRAVALIRAMPLPPDPDDVGLDAARERPLGELVPEARELALMAHERNAATALATGVADARRFFARQAPRVLVGGRTPTIAHDVRDLVDGHVVIRARDEDQLRALLRHVPPGTLTERPLALGYFIVPRGPTFDVRYPARGWRRTIHEVSWARNPDNAADRVTVMVATAGEPPRHSYSLDQGLTWRPTGAPNVPALGAELANLWAGYLAERQDRYGQDAREAIGGHGGR
ncbi:hypothetical protein [Xylophilus sp. GOD-11R]|uniref:hypothetical protein n=1 Tax=Xylophilus sp. GOD-11R TaxID=3089814 RepID=UPI00298C959E|nr:hypothetical protein [Xylophilus sp. GOD-11R]WPB57827.1 hypothetical protein R9X41_04040 [Xylophilus sp. GOD-11R]